MNPIMPLWEHIADGEPHVFTNPETGEERIYVYGSHDTSKTFFCALDYELWSAPVHDLSDWKNHGMIHKVEKTDPDAFLASLFAPDCCQGPDERFYLFAFPIGAVSDMTNVFVSDTPEGPFKPHGRIDYLGDPAVLVDDDGSVYVYNGGPGFKTPIVSRLKDDMLTTIDTMEMKMVDGSNIPNFFEASSIRKVDGIYVYIYSSLRYNDPKYVNQSTVGAQGGYALLEYCYGDSPTGPWNYGGILMDNGGVPLGTPDDYYYGTRRSYYNGTIHGSIEKIKNQWYVFYHKNTNNHDFSRQTCMEPIEICVIDGRVIIGQPEMTSQGWETKGIFACQKIPAGSACYLTNGAYITDTPLSDKDINPIVNITNGTVAGFKYIDFGSGSEYDLFLEISLLGQCGKIAVRMDAPNGKTLTKLYVPNSKSEKYRPFLDSVGYISGKHAIYFVFYAEHENEICCFNSFEFMKK